MREKAYVSNVLTLGAWAVGLAAASAFAEPTWPSDFDTQVASRLAAAETNNADSQSGTAAAYDTWRWTSDVLSGLGTTLSPFETRSLTWEQGVCDWLNTNPTKGFLMLFQ